MPPILIAIVEDDEAVRLSTCYLLKGAGFDVKPFKSGEDFLAGGTSDPVACILLDMRMPGCGGLAVLHALKERGNSPPVLVITGHGDVALAVDAMKLGAHDFMEKPYEVSVLLAAIEKALASHSTVEVTQTIRSEARTLVETLSRRQRQVLQLILGGLQNKLIAHELGLSIRTIEAYRSQLLTKLGVTGTAGAVRLALAAGLST